MQVFTGTNTLQQAACVVCAAAAFVILCIQFYVPKGLPPGFSGLRCLLEIPSQKAWLKMLEVNRKYGL